MGAQRRRFGMPRRRKNPSSRPKESDNMSQDEVQVVDELQERLVRNSLTPPIPTTCSGRESADAADSLGSADLHDTAVESDDSSDDLAFAARFSRVAASKLKNK